MTQLSSEDACNPADDNALVVVGARLRAAREARHLSIDDVAGRMRLPPRILRAVEAGDVSQLGAVVYVRGHLQAYARLLGVAPDEISAALDAPVAPPPLVAMAPSTRMQRMVDQMARRSVYVVLTAVLVVPAFIIATQEPGTPTRVALDAPAVPGPVAPASGPGTQLPLDVGTATSAPEASPDLSPIMASLTPFRTRASEWAAVPPAPAAEGDGLVMRFSGESWVEVFGHDGERLQQALMRHGDELRFPAGEVARVTLGNAGVVEVVSAGQRRDTARFSRANVARFTVSSDGDLAASGG